jgi:hypothetical protein
MDRGPDVTLLLCHACHLSVNNARQTNWDCSVPVMWLAARKLQKVASDDYAGRATVTSCHVACGSLRQYNLLRKRPAGNNAQVRGSGLHLTNRACIFCNHLGCLP